MADKKEVDTKGTRAYDVHVCRRHTKKHYTVNELMEAKVFWWTTSRRIYIDIIKRDQELHKALEIETTGEGLGTRYKIKGRSIKKFYKLYGAGIQLLKTK